MRMPKPFLIWDFDGTLYDSYPQMAEALCLALRDFSVTADVAEIYALQKVTLYHACTVYANRHGLAVDALLAAYRRRHAVMDAPPPMPDAAACLRACSALGCRQALFTHRDRSALDALARDGLLPLFVDAVLRTDGFADKPAPDAILHLMRKHGIAAQDTWMIGDRDIDLQAGRNAGVHTALYDPDGFFPGLQADLHLETLAELPRRLSAVPGFSAP